MIHTIQKNMSATYILSANSKRNSNNNSPAPDENKICQWYCCLCGQCFGQIYYKNDYKENKELKLTNELVASTSNSTAESNLMDRLKYYSKIVYNQAESSASTSSSRLGSEVMEEAQDYFQIVPTPSSGLISPSTTTLELIDRNYNYNFSREKSDHLHPDNNQPNDNLYPSNAGSLSDVVLKIPTRFTCHRCDHMMCPYCPKIRLKDLDNDN